MAKEVKGLFTPNPMNLCCSERNQSSSVVRTKPYPTKRIVGSYVCGGWYCEVCIDVNETWLFTSGTVTGDLIINHRFDCNERCLVYNKCNMQYAGQTIGQLQSRWTNYKSDSRKHDQGATCMQQHLFNHLCASGHSGFLGDALLVFIDKTDPSDHLKKEGYWSSMLKMTPFKFNIEESI